METITAQEALGRLANRYKEKIETGEQKKLIGLDIKDYASVFQRGTEVTILEYYQKNETLAGTLMNHKEELLKQLDGVSDIVVQVISAKSHVLMMEDMNELAAFVGLLGEDVNFYWGIEYEETTAFKVKIEVYIVR